MSKEKKNPTTSIRGVLFMSPKGVFTSLKIPVMKTLNPSRPMEKPIPARPR